MITVKGFLTLFFTFFTILLYSQGNKVKIDLSNLDLGKVSANSVYIQAETSYRLSDSKELTIVVKQLPTYIRLSILKGHTFHTQKLYWIEKENVTIEGNLEKVESLVIIPQNNLQEFTDKIAQQKKIESEVEDELAYTKPFLVHFERYKSFYKREYIIKVMSNLPSSLNDFWASKLLNQYIIDLENVGYDPVEKKFSYLTAINKDNQEQRIENSNGKYLLLDFSSPGCVWCIKGIDGLVDFDSKYKNQLEIVMLWNDFVYDDWLNYQKEHQSKITFNNLLDENGAIFKAMGIDVYPTYMLFNPEGDLVKKWKGGKLPKDITKYFN